MQLCDKVAIIIIFFYSVAESSFHMFYINSAPMINFDIPLSIQLDNILQFDISMLLS